MNKLSRIVAPAIFMSVALGSAVAAGFDAKQVSADARWVAHLDAGTLKQTVLGRYIVGQMATPEANRKFEAFKAVFQFDPREDLESVTLYGTGKAKEEGVALFQGRFNTDQLVTLIKGNENYSSEVHGTRIIHSWIDEKKPGTRSYGCVVRNDQVVVGDSETLVKHAVDVLEGRARTLSDSCTLPGIADAARSTFFIGAADMKKMPNVAPKAAVLKKNEAVSLSFGETNGRLNGLLRMVAKDEKTATAVHKIAEGLMSLATLDEDQDPGVVQFIESLQFNLSGKEVSVTLDYPAADAVKFLQACEAKKKVRDEE